jgi:WD40 repeat protein
VARLWDATTGKQIGPSLGHPQVVTEVAFSPDGHVAATASNQKVQLWEAATGQPIGPPLYCPVGACGLAFAADGRTVLVGAREIVRLWDVKPASAGTVRELILAAQVLTGLEITSDGTLRALDGSAWQQRRVRLGGQGGTGPP